MGEGSRRGNSVRRKYVAYATMKPITQYTNIKNLCLHCLKSAKCTNNNESTSQDYCKDLNEFMCAKYFQQGL